MASLNNEEPDIKFKHIECDESNLPWTIVTVRTAKCHDCTVTQKAVARRCWKCAHLRCAPCFRIKGFRHACHDAASSFGPFPTLYQEAAILNTIHGAGVPNLGPSQRDARGHTGAWKWVPSALALKMDKDVRMTGRQLFLPNLKGVAPVNVQLKREKADKTFEYLSSPISSSVAGSSTPARPSPARPRLSGTGSTAINRQQSSPLLPSSPPVPRVMAPEPFTPPSRVGPMSQNHAFADDTPSTTKRSSISIDTSDVLSSLDDQTPRLPSRKRRVIESSSDDEEITLPVNDAEGDGDDDDQEPDLPQEVYVPRATTRGLRSRGRIPDPVLTELSGPLLGHRTVRRRLDDLSRLPTGMQQFGAMPKDLSGGPGNPFSTWPEKMQPPPGDAAPASPSDKNNVGIALRRDFVVDVRKVDFLKITMLPGFHLGNVTGSFPIAPVASGDAPDEIYGPDGHQAGEIEHFPAPFRAASPAANDEPAKLPLHVAYQVRDRTSAGELERHSVAVIEPFDTDVARTIPEVQKLGRDGSFEPRWQLAQDVHNVFKRAITQNQDAGDDTAYHTPVPDGGRVSPPYALPKATERAHIDTGRDGKIKAGRDKVTDVNALGPLDSDQGWEMLHDGWESSEEEEEEEEAESGEIEEEEVESDELEEGEIEDGEVEGDVDMDGDDEDDAEDY